MARADGPLCPEETAPSVFSPEQLAQIKQIVDAKKTIVTIYTMRVCADGAYGLAVLQEATPQGKAVRFVVSPNDLKAQDVPECNRQLKKLQELYGKQ